jgi:hypothetical protein
LRELRFVVVVAGSETPKLAPQGRVMPGLPPRGKELGSGPSFLERITLGVSCQKPFGGSLHKRGQGGTSDVSLPHPALRPPGHFGARHSAVR